MSELQILGSNRKAAWLNIFVVCAHESHFSVIDVESAFRSAIGWRSTRCGTSSEVDLDRYFKWFDLYAYPCFYCCNYFASAADVRTHIHADHINQPFKITTKKESSNDDDDRTRSFCDFGNCFDSKPRLLQSTLTDFKFVIFIQKYTLPVWLN
jgi:hypothetical protein